jgi:TonB family protein
MHIQTRTAGAGKGRTIGFVGLSAILHVAIVIGLTYYTLLKPKPEIIEIEFKLATAAPIAAPGEKPIEKAESSAVDNSTADVPVANNTRLNDRSEVIVKKAKNIAQNKPTRVHRSSPKLITEPAVKLIKDKNYKSKPVETYDLDSESEVPMLDDDLGETKVLVPENLQAQEIENDFDEVDHQENSKILKASQDLSEQSDKEMKNIDQEFDALKQLVVEDDQDLDNKAKSLKAKRDSEMATALAAQNAKKQKFEGEGGNGLNAYEGKSNVRALEDLRQMPGNKKPMYGVDDRLRKRQGDITLLAYITKSGVPAKFELVNSTGHRELDSKTLAALKEWRFYPGQEGWVEIPFKWDLKGGVQEKPTTLRRKVGAN